MMLVVTKLWNYSSLVSRPRRPARSSQEAIVVNLDSLWPPER